MDTFVVYNKVATSLFFALYPHVLSTVGVSRVVLVYRPENPAHALLLRVHLWGSIRPMPCIPRRADGVRTCGGTTRGMGATLAVACFSLFFILFRLCFLQLLQSQRKVGRWVIWVEVETRGARAVVSGRCATFVTIKKCYYYLSREMPSI